MGTLPWGLAAAELVALLAFLTPLGLGLLRGLEGILSIRFRLLPVERPIVAAFAAGGLLFGVASSGLPLFQLPVVIGLAAVGWAVMVVLWARERARSLADLAGWLRRWSAWVVIGGFVAVLALEAYGVASFQFNNSYDGATHSLWVTVLLRDHQVPWTVQPFANVGITYPQGGPVWEALPPLLLGWPVTDSPVYLPTLFFALAVPAAYALGWRLDERSSAQRELTGAVFAGFFALVAAFPRLFLGGSYDVVIAFPLFLLTLAWLPRYVRPGAAERGEVAGYALAVGIVTSLSWMLGLELLTLVASFGVVQVVLQRASLKAMFLRWIAAVIAAAVFLTRSIAGTVAWASYPGRVLAPVGSPPYATLGTGAALTYRYVTQELDPFVPFKQRLSPIPWMSVLIAVLLAAGIVILVAGFALGRRPWSALIPHRLARVISLAAVTTFVELVVLIVLAAPGTHLPGVIELTNADEISIVLFLLYGIIAIVPILACVELLSDRAVVASRPSVVPGLAPPFPTATRRRARPPPVRVVAVVVIVLVFVAGGVSTAADLPGYIQGHIRSIADVTDGDIDALEWASSHMPSCARVFIAPGSAAQYLPEYAVVSVVFPAFPTIYNLSYVNAVSALVNGTYDGSIRADLLELSVDAVFVTGPTTVQFPALNPSAFQNSADFSVAFAAQDAEILSFLPGVHETGCAIPLGVGTGTAVRDVPSAPAGDRA